jgi:hypothetical protein
MNGARVKVVKAGNLRTSEQNQGYLFVSTSFLPNRTTTVRTQVAVEHEQDEDASSAGLCPLWDESLRLPRDADATALVMEIFVEGMLTNELVGNCVIDFADYDQVNGTLNKFAILGSDGNSIGVLSAMISLENTRQSQAFIVPPSPEEDTVGEMISVAKLKPSERRRTTILNNCHRTLVVEVIRAGGMQNLNVFTNMDPYCRAALLPSRKSKGQTPVVEGGGTDPEWDDGINDVWENRVLLPPDPTASCLSLEVWNQETVEDQLVGKVEINFFDEALQLGQAKADRVQYNLDTGGCVLLLIFYTL